jgi:hypothetical protein
MQRKAIKKITDSMQGCEEKRVPAAPIAKYLKEKCKQDKEFCTLVMQEHKTLEKCFDFVFEQAKNHLNNDGGGWIEDNDVYMMAVDYFNLDDAEIERQKAEEAAKLEEARRQREAEREQFRKTPHSTAETEQMTFFGEGE